MDDDAASAINGAAAASSPDAVPSQPPSASSHKGHKRKKQASGASDDPDTSAASSSKPKPQKQKTSASSAAAAASAGSSSGAIAQPAALAPFVPHSTLGSLFPAQSASSCPCGLRRSSRKLVLGDGDLSYSVGLVRHLCSPEHAAYEARDDAAIAAAAASTAAQPWSFDNCITDAEARAFYASAATPPSASTSSEQLADASSFTVAPASLNLVCTTYESAAALADRYAHSADNAQLLRSWGIKVLHQVDARLLESYGQQLEPGVTKDAANGAVDATMTVVPSSDAASFAAAASSAASRRVSFHTILFHFPHVGGKSRIHLNRALLADFLASAAKLLVRRGDVMRGVDAQSSSSAQGQAVPSGVESRDGCIHVSLLRGQGGTPSDPTARPRYGDSWQVLEQASRSSLVLAHVLPFHARLYDGYNSKGFRSRDEEFSERRGSGVTHVLVPAEEAETGFENDLGVSSSCGLDAVPPSLHAFCSSDPLCDEQFHPLTIVKEELAQFFRTHRSGSTADAAGMKPLPFVAAPQTVVDLPGSPAAVHEEPSHSSFIIARVQFDAASLNTLQWNLDPIEAVANDMESQLPQPYAAALLKQPAVAAAAATAPASSGAAASSMQALAAVPLMREGLPLTHSLVVEQRFDAAPADQPMTDGAPALSSLSTDMERAARGAIAALFGEAPLVRCNPSVTASGCTDVLLQSLEGVWHTIARGCVDANRSGLAPSWRLEFSLDALALLRHRLSDPRWLWSRDDRVRAQWKQLAAAATAAVSASPRPQRFVPFAMHTLAQVRDNSFWINPVPGTNKSDSAAAVAAAASSVAAAPPRPPMDAATFKRLYTAAVLRLVGPSLCCSLQVTDQFSHPIRGESIRFRLLYHSVDRALSPDAVTRLQERLHDHVIRTTGVEMR